MKFSINRDTLLNAMQMTIGTTVAKATPEQPIFAHVKIVVANNVLSVTAANGSAEICVDAQLEGVNEDCAFTSPAKKLLDIIKALPQAIELKFSDKDDAIILRAGRSRYKLAPLDANLYPSTESFKVRSEVTLPCADLKKMIDSVSCCMANNDVRYYLNGMLLDICSEKMNLIAVATDGHRLALDSVICDNVSHSQAAIVPFKAVSEVVKLLSSQGVGSTVTLSIGDNLIRFSFPNCVFTTALIDGRFPDYNRVIPKANDKTIKLDTAVLKSALKRASILSNEKFRGVELEFGNDELTISTRNPQQEAAEEIVEIGYNDSVVNIGFNVQYMLDALNSLLSDELNIHLKDSSSPAIIKSTLDADNATFILMPMRI